MNSQTCSNQLPTYRQCGYYEKSLISNAAEIADRCGFELMEWQKGVLRDWLALDEGSDEKHPRWFNTTCGASIPRQNGKTWLICWRIAYGMVKLNETVIYTAHLQKTATETFEQLRDIFESPLLASRVKEVRNAIGREEIRLHNGARCKFLSRSRNGGRGQHASLLVMDEAQAVTDSMVASFLPAISASSNPQTIYVGTPPDEGETGETFPRMHSQAHEGGKERACWSEWAATSTEQADDREAWKRCNPSYGLRIMESTVEGERAQMEKLRFLVERCGLWVVASFTPVFNLVKWEERAVKEPPENGVTSYGVKFSPDGLRVALAVCCNPKDGATPPHVEVVRVENMTSGLSWLTDWLMKRQGKTATVVIDGKSGSQYLIDELRRSGYSPRAITSPSTGDVITACSSFLDAVNSDRMTHYDQSVLNDCVKNAVRRSIGKTGGWGFDGNGGFDVTPLEAAALAYWGAITTKRDPRRVAKFSF